MRRFAALLALSLAACASGSGGRPGDGPRLRPTANPSAVIAAEIAFNRLAQEKGQWTAFRETAAKGAELFVPERVLAEDWLKGRPDPSVPVTWQPGEVWSSCDGSYAVTRGAWQRPGSVGSFVTVWQRQKDGEYRWLLDMSLADEAALPPSDTVNATVADCRPVRQDSLVRTPATTDTSVELRSGESNDRSMSWQALSTSSGGRHFTLWIARDGDMREVLKAQLPSASTR